MFGTQKKLKLETLQSQSEALFEVLHGHGVFGESEGKWLESEKRGFMGMVEDHAISRDHNYLEITYSGTCVRLIINLTVNEKNEAVFKDITAYDHPWANEDMDYEALNLGFLFALHVTVKS